MNREDAHAVFASIKRHLPHVAKRVERAADRLVDLGMPLTQRTLLRAVAFELEYDKAREQAARGEGA